MKNHVAANCETCMANTSVPTSVPSSRRSPRRRMRFEIRMLYFALFAGFPAVLVTVLLLWFGEYSDPTRWTLTSLVVVFWLGAAVSLRSHLVYPLQTLSNLLSALREEDYSLRARGARPDDALGEVLVEVNALGDVLRGRRLGSLEATALLRKVMEEIDVAVYLRERYVKHRRYSGAGAGGWSRGWDFAD